MSSLAPKGERIRHCPKCEAGVLAFADDIATEIEGYTFIQRGWRCGSCGEEFIPEEEGERMIAVAERLGIWGEPLSQTTLLDRQADSQHYIRATLDGALWQANPADIPLEDGGQITLEYTNR